MDSKPLAKPSHNRYDNIWEVRQSGYPNDSEVERCLKRGDAMDYVEIGNGIRYYSSAEGFLKAVLSQGCIKLPVWKVLCPRLDNKKVGSIYYIVKDCDGKRHVYRATYGYWGTGPHEAALIEHVLESRGLTFEVRDGDYLLGLLDLI
ncbi:MAG: hypothetical protein QXG35_08630 [Nitrososphaerota archaeon]